MEKRWTVEMVKKRVGVGYNYRKILHAINDLSNSGYINIGRGENNKMLLSNDAVSMVETYLSLPRDLRATASFFTFVSEQIGPIKSEVFAQRCLRSGCRFRKQ